MRQRINWIGEQYWDQSSDDGLFQIIEEDSGGVKLSIFGNFFARDFGRVQVAKDHAEEVLDMIVERFVAKQ